MIDLYNLDVDATNVYVTDHLDYYLYMALDSNDLPAHAAWPFSQMVSSLSPIRRTSG
jgi:hypothetical protein